MSEREAGVMYWPAKVGPIIPEGILTDRDREMLEQTPIGRAALAEMNRLELEAKVLREWLTLKQDRIEILETELAQKRR